MATNGYPGWGKAAMLRAFMQKGREGRKVKGRNDIIIKLQTSNFKLMTNLASFGYFVACQLLPSKALLQLESWHFGKETPQITLIASSTKAVAHCPVCQELTHRIHSRYERKLTDLPWADYSITLQLQVRKFFCINALCKRRIFTERLGGVIAPWARKTLRLAEKLTAIGLALGGNAGVHLSQNLGFVVSRNTLLQMVRRIPLPQVITPETLGVDDACFSQASHLWHDISRSGAKPTNCFAQRSLFRNLECLVASPSWS